MTNAQFLNIAFEKNALHYLHYCTLEGESAESAESAKQKNTIFIQAAKMEEDIFYLSKITKNESKILLSFTKDAKETKVRVYKK